VKEAHAFCYEKRTCLSACLLPGMADKASKAIICLPDRRTFQSRIFGTSHGLFWNFAKNWKYPILCDVGNVCNHTIGVTMNSANLTAVKGLEIFGSLIFSYLI